MKKCFGYLWMSNQIFETFGHLFVLMSSVLSHSGHPEGHERRCTYHGGQHRIGQKGSDQQARGRSSHKRLLVRTPTHFTSLQRQVITNACFGECSFFLFFFSSTLVELSLK